MKTFVRLFVLFSVIALLAGPAALAADQKNVFRFQLSYFMPSGDLTMTDAFEEDIDGDGTIDTLALNEKAEYDSAIGFGIEYEYMASDLIGLDFGLKYIKPDVKLNVSGTFNGDPFTLAEIKEGGEFMPLTAGVMFHLGDSEKLDFYLGPELAYIMYGDITFVDPFFGDEAKIKFNDEFTFGAKLGLDFAIGEKWAITAQAEYIAADSEVDADEGDDISVSLDPSPFLLNVGVAYKF